MDLDDNDEDCMPPPNTNTFGIPNDPELLAEYALYRPSMAARRILSERNREVYSEAFIENERLGTLADLCVRALAKLGTLHIAAPVRQDPLKLRIHYDSIDVNLPLRECYFVDDLRFWRRVVLAKSSDKSLPLKKLHEYDWKGQGISIKYVELVESCEAGYWPEKEMSELAALVSNHVRTLHIRHLQSLTERAFNKHLESDSELDVTSEESEQLEISSDEPDTNDEEEVDEEDDQSSVHVTSKFRLTNQTGVAFDKGTKLEVEEPSISPGEPEPFYLIDDPDNASEKRRRSRSARNAGRQELRNLNEAKKAEREIRKRRRSMLRKVPVEPKRKRKRKRAGTLQGVFNIKVAPEPEDNEDQIIDRRNKEKLLRRLKLYDYPSKHCHHIDLSFIRYFNNLVSFTLEFLGPQLGREFHSRHLKFSYDDMTRLSRGLRTLEKLKIFRLRNSQMDVIKVQILVRALKNLPSLEVIDFGYDQMSDECGAILGSFLRRDKMIKALELEYNHLDTMTASAIGLALRQNNEEKLVYLGLGHNPMGDEALHILCRHIVGTHHVEELNISAIEASKDVVFRELDFLLRKHKPLRRLDMVALPLNPELGKELICALHTNENITHFDCRGCELDTDEEFEADMVVRRNEFRSQHKYVGDATKTEADILSHFKGIKHPVVKKIEQDMSRRSDCIKVRPNQTPSEPSLEEEHEERSEQEYDIWAELGIKTGNYTVAKIEIEPEPSQKSAQSLGPFTYDPNSFDLNQFREYVHQPGPGNRYYYFQQNKF